MDPNIITEKIIGCAIEVHRQLGPGLLESPYRECLAHEFTLAGLGFQKEKCFPLSYKGIQLDAAYRVDLVVENTVIVEVKAVLKVDPVFNYQLLTYLKLTGCPIGLLMNFNVPVLKDGITRRVFQLREDSAALRMKKGRFCATD